MDHTLVRGSSARMRCRLCSLEQPIAAFCANAACAWKQTLYFCEPCRLWEDNPTKSIFHCDGCGICRVGRREDYFHCDSCSLCQPNRVKDKHACIAGVTSDVCPICRDLVDMKLSTKSIMMLPCGHAMHDECRLQLMMTQEIPMCPTCRKSIVRDADHEHMLADLIRQTPMPAELNSVRAVILCNDCGARSTVPYHFYGNICANEQCGSANTTVLRTTGALAFQQAAAAPSHAGHGSHSNGSGSGNNGTSANGDRGGSSVGGQRHEQPRRG